MKFLVYLTVALACVGCITCDEDEGAIKRTLTRVTSAAENGAQKLQGSISNGAKNLQSVVSKGSDQVRKMAEGLQARADSYVAAQQAKADEPRRGMISSTIRGAGRLARNFTVEGARFVGSIGSTALKMAKNTATATALAAVESVDRLRRRGGSKKPPTDDKQDSQPSADAGNKPEELTNVEASQTADAAATEAAAPEAATEAAAPEAETEAATEAAAEASA